MKKYLLLASVAALAFTSCSDQSTEFVGDEAAQKAREITFAPVAKPNTRATAAIDGTTFPTAYNFFISAYAVEAAGDYFNKAEYANESSIIWSGKDASNKQYWPLSPETLNFLAVTKSDADGTNTTFGTATPDAYASKVVVALSDNRTAQHDLMYSYARAAVTKTGNALSYNSGNNVAMAFAHAQAWVNFTVKAGDVATAGAGITVTGIQLKQAVYEGTATVTLANYNSKTLDLSATLAWDGTAYGSAPKYDVNVPANQTAFSAVAVNSTSEIAAGDGLMIVPNPTKTGDDLNASFTTFVISYTLNGRAYTFEYTPTDAQKRMEPAHKYDFNITFTLHEIKVDATVTDWTDADYAVAIPAV